MVEFVKICGVKIMDEFRFVERYVDVMGVVVNLRLKRKVLLKMVVELIEMVEILIYFVFIMKIFLEWVNVVEKIGVEYI